MKILLICSQFWADFWPNFSSTMLGLLLGTPLALYTNKKINEVQEREKGKTDKQRLKDALEIILQTIIENKQRVTHR